MDALNCRIIAKSDLIELKEFTIDQLKISGDQQELEKHQRDLDCLNAVTR